jgi:hypothetical protein
LALALIGKSKVKLESAFAAFPDIFGTFYGSHLILQLPTGKGIAQKALTD